MKGSSEIQEAAKLCDQLIAQSAVILPADYDFKPANRPRALKSRAGSPKPPPFRRMPAASVDTGETYRGDRLENMLHAMCKQGGFIGAVLVDANGLPLAIYNSPVKNEAVASAFAMVLGEALTKAGSLIGRSEANTIAIDINYTDKASVRRFLIGDLPYFLMVICPQDIDERAEVEVSIERIIGLLKKN